MPTKSYWQREQEARQRRQSAGLSKRRAGQELTKIFRPINRGQADIWESTADIVAAVSGHGGGKRLSLDTPIPTPDGWKTMGEISVGDTLFGDDGLPCHVRALSEIAPQAECYEVRFANGSSIIADRGHEWFTTTRSERKRHQVGKRRTTVEIRNTLKIKPTGAPNHFIAAPQAVILPVAKLPIHPYILGAWLGDGESSNNVLCGADDEIFEKIESSGVHIGKQLEQRSNKKRRHTLHGIRPALRSLDLLGKGKKRIPSIYLRASIIQRLELLRGLMDTDGYAALNGRCEFTSTNAVLASDMCELLASLGIIAFRSEGRALLDGKDCGPKWRINFTEHKVPVFNLWRKLSRQLRSRHRPSSAHYAIVSVEPVAPRPARCIAVDNASHLYLVGASFIPTSNSQVGAYWLLREAKHWPGDTFIVAGPTYNTLEKSSIPKLKGILELHGLPWEYDHNRKIGFRVQQKQYMLPHGGIIYFVSCDKPGSMQGTHARAFWMDETVDTGYYAFETLWGRVALNEGRGIITSTPYDMGWLYTQIYQAWIRAGRPDSKHAKDIFVAQWKSIENRFFSKARYAQLQATLEPWRFRLLYEGEFERPMGLVYDCFTPETWIEPFDIPAEWPRKCGLDFGIVDPTACLWMAQAPDKTWIAYDEYYQSGWMRFANGVDVESAQGKHSTQMELIDEVLAKCIERDERPKVYCDDSGKDYIIQTQEKFYDSLGVNTVWPAHKKDITSGIQRCYGLVRSGKFRIFNTLKHFRDEVESYSYAIDKDTGELAKGAAPKDNNNHLMDAWRYAVVGSPDETFNSFGFGKIDVYDDFRYPGLGR